MQGLTKKFCRSMTPADLKTWQLSMGYTQKQASDALGVALATYCDMRRGIYRNSKKPAVISKSIALACTALNFERLSYAATYCNVT